MAAHTSPARRARWRRATQWLTLSLSTLAAGIGVFILRQRCLALDLLTIIALSVPAALAVYASTLLAAADYDSPAELAELRKKFCQDPRAVLSRHPPLLLFKREDVLLSHLRTAAAEHGAATLIFACGQARGGGLNGIFEFAPGTADALAQLMTEQLDGGLGPRLGLSDLCALSAVGGWSTVLRAGSVLAAARARVREVAATVRTVPELAHAAGGRDGVVALLDAGLLAAGSVASIVEAQASAGEQRPRAGRAEEDEPLALESALSAVGRGVLSAAAHARLGEGPDASGRMTLALCELLARDVRAASLSGHVEALLHGEGLGFAAHLPELRDARLVQALVEMRGRLSEQKAEERMAMDTAEERAREARIARLDTEMELLTLRNSPVVSQELVDEAAKKASRAEAALRCALDERADIRRKHARARERLLSQLRAELQALGHTQEQRGAAY